MLAKEASRLVRHARSCWALASVRQLHSPSVSGRSTTIQPASTSGAEDPFGRRHGLLNPFANARGMFIQTQPTPNPASLMFLPGRGVSDSGSREFLSARESMASPLAKKLFSVEGVKSVFFGSDFITITKVEDATWAVLKPDVFAAITDHFASGDPIFTEEGSADPSTSILPDDSEIVASIKELLETRIRPVVQDDGGDVLFKTFDESSGVVTLKMVGACSGCPSSSATLKGGIENMLKHYVPEVKEVVQAFDEGEKAGMEEFNKLEAQLST
ncbi:hypothetical protein BSKO_01468 [Bryopsis sp. KO-2023]|nr:hypothetical protein BSKO_01468 [Bryopsis sp. KO-2023]